MVKQKSSLNEQQVSIHVQHQMPELISL